MKKTRESKYFAPQTKDARRTCDHPGCTKKGEFRAPKDRSLKDYYWFCLEHVQDYNSEWNYYEGISAEAPEENEAADMHFKNFTNVKYNFMGDFDNYNNDFSFLYTKEELKFFQTLEIKPGEANLALIKKQYKKLAKKYHPDLNQSDKSMEEKFKNLSTAYKYLLTKFS